MSFLQKAGLPCLRQLLQTEQGSDASLQDGLEATYLSQDCSWVATS